MKIQVDRNVLLAPLEAVHGIVEKKNTEAILAHVLLESANGRLRLTATDRAMQVSAAVEADTEFLPCTVSALKLRDLLRALPEGANVSLDLDGARLRLSCGESKFRLQTLPAESFPRMAPPAGPGEAVLPQRELKKLLAQTQAAMGDEDVRFYLNGALLCLRETQLVLAATNGHRLAEAAVALEAPTAAVDIILPRKAALELHDLLKNSDEPVHLRVQPDRAAFRFDRVEFITAGVDGVFPNYQRAIPERFDQRFRVDRVLFAQALERVRVLVEAKHWGMHWRSGGGRLCMTAANGFQEDAEEMLLVECNGEVVDSGFNVNYLIDGLDSAGGEQVECALVRSPGGLQITEPGNAQFRYFCMSMRV